MSVSRLILKENNKPLPCHLQCSNTEKQQIPERKEAEASMYAHSILLACTYIQEATMLPPPIAKMTFPFDLLVLFSSWHTYFIASKVSCFSQMCSGFFAKEVKYKVSSVQNYVLFSKSKKLCFSFHF